MPTLPIIEALASNWWLLLVRGIIAVLFGLLAFMWPGLTLVTLVLLYAAYALVDGLMAIWAGATSRTWGLVLFGILGVLVGIYALFFPGITALALLYLIAAWAFIRGLFEIATAIQMRKQISNEWSLILSGIIAIVFAIVLVANPSAGALAMIFVIGTFAILFGLAMIFLAFRIKSLPKRLANLAHS
jgi:uncharacterized membrane protein HdeD (DUF308 family)